MWKSLISRGKKEDGLLSGNLLFKGSYSSEMNWSCLTGSYESEYPKRAEELFNYI